MVKFTRNMLKCLENIKKEVILIYETSGEEAKTISIKPTKKKTFKAFVFNLGKPSFQFYINDHFYGTYFYDSKEDKWSLVQ